MNGLMILICRSMSLLVRVLRPINPSPSSGTRSFIATLITEYHPLTGTYLPTNKRLLSVTYQTRHMSILNMIEILLIFNTVVHSPQTRDYSLRLDTLRNIPLLWGFIVMLVALFLWLFI